jgi:hypothetical protein
MWWWFWAVPYLRVQSASGPIYEWTDPDRYFAGIELIKANKAKYFFSQAVNCLGMVW